MNTKKRASSRGGGGAHPLHPPPRSPLHRLSLITVYSFEAGYKNAIAGE